MAPSSQKNTKSVVTMWRGPLHAYHDGLRAVITEAAASGSLSGPSVRGPGGGRIFFNSIYAILFSFRTMILLYTTAFVLDLPTSKAPPFV